jgi:hypothetical protein
MQSTAQFVVQRCRKDAEVDSMVSISEMRGTGMMLMQQ